MTPCINIKLRLQIKKRGDSMIKELIDKVIDSIREDCENISSLYEDNSCKYCKHNFVCEAISKLTIDK